jgi:predicted AAA+ superfamily ATPase
MKELRRRHIALVDNTSLKFERYLAHELPWKERLVGIKGPRGVGKTTLLLQYIKKTYASSNNSALYISLDDLFFTDNKLIDLADEFVAKGGKHLFIDEVHKYPNWIIELKKIYDYHPGLKVIFTGSSLLEILSSRGDLSRRALLYDMQGLSFREYIAYQHLKSFPEYKLTDILEGHTSIAIDIAKHFKPLQYFDSYLQTGYFPFYDKDKILYYKRIMEVLNMVIEIELPNLKQIDVTNLRKIKKLLYIISRSVPFKPNISSLANKIDVARNSLLEYLYGLKDAKLINTIHKDNFGISLLQKPEKVYLENTNLVYALSEDEPNTGNLRETFFLNQLSLGHSVTYPEKGDFLVDGKYLFEVGGKNKSHKQISGIENAFIAADNIEFGYENQIPLWIFGFLY